MEKVLKKGTKFTLPSLTQQHLSADCDINAIMAKARRTGFVPVNAKQAMFGDVSDVGTYHDMVKTVMNAEMAFMTLPAFVRDRFQHDPENLLKFLSDSGNQEEAYKLGLAIRPVVSSPVEEVPEAPAQ